MSPFDLYILNSLTLTLAASHAPPVPLITISSAICSGGSSDSILNLILNPESDGAPSNCTQVSRYSRRVEVSRPSTEIAIRCRRVEISNDCKSSGAHSAICKCVLWYIKNRIYWSMVLSKNRDHVCKQALFKSIIYIQSLSWDH